MNDQQEWFGPLSTSRNSCTNNSSYLIILNTPIGTSQQNNDQNNNLFKMIWNSSLIRICADGGANRLFDFTQNEKINLNHLKLNQEDTSLIPDFIKGDLDSIKPQVKKYYQGKNHCKLIYDSDQDTTDLGKCIKLIQEIEKNKEENKSLSTIIIHGGLGGRLDQTIHTLHTLLKLQSTLDESSTEVNQSESYHQSFENLPETWVLDTHNGSMACALKPGITHFLHIPKLFKISHQPLTCGILPLGINHATVTTSGLKWNLDKTKTSMLGLLSTSNQILPEAQVVIITTDETIIWTMEIPIQA